jgi:hypothetical protein
MGTRPSNSCARASVIVICSVSLCAARVASPKNRAAGPRTPRACVQSPAERLPGGVPANRAETTAAAKSSGAITRQASPIDTMPVQPRGAMGISDATTTRTSPGAKASATLATAPQPLRARPIRSSDACMCSSWRPGGAATGSRSCGSRLYPRYPVHPGVVICMPRSGLAVRGSTRCAALPAPSGMSGMFGSSRPRGYPFGALVIDR